MNPSRPLLPLLILAWLLALLPADALAFIPRTAPTMPALSALRAAADAAPLTLHLDGVYEGGEVRSEAK